MHQACTCSEGTDKAIKDHAKTINDAKILAKVAMADMCAQGAVYHKYFCLHYLTKLENTIMNKMKLRNIHIWKA